MPEPSEYLQAGDVFRKSMEEAMVHLDQLKEELHKEQKKAIDDQIATQEELHRIEREAHSISEAYMEKHRKEIEQRIHDEILLDVTQKLILAEIPSNKIKKYLDLTSPMLADVWFKIGFEKMDDLHVGHVGYEGSGRSGSVIFYRDDVTLRFYYEFGGGSTVAIIFVPTLENWEKETGLQSDERMPILEFVAKRAIRDQAPNCHYEIGNDSILLKY